MVTSPAPPRPPAPPRSSAPVLGIVLLILALIITVAGLAVWVGLHYISRAVHLQVAQSSNGQKDVSIKTPLGSLEVEHNVSEAGLGLPIYPGATRLNDRDSATVNIHIADEAKFRVLVAKFVTGDSREKVRAFYQERLGNQVTKYRERDEEGNTVFEIKHDKQQQVVALKSDGDQTEIDLVRVSEGRNESN
jgi:hypothetical protein